MVELGKRDEYLLKGLGYVLLVWISRLITHSDSSDINLIVIFIFIGSVSALLAFINLFMGICFLFWDFLDWLVEQPIYSKKAKP